MYLVGYFSCLVGGTNYLYVCVCVTDFFVTRNDLNVLSIAFLVEQRLVFLFSY